MKKIFLMLTILILFYYSNNSAQEKKFGLGVIIGEPTGISAKLWTSSANALVLGVGWSVQGYRINGFDPEYDRASRTHIHVDYLWHSFNAISSDGRFPFYYGLGGRINSGPVYSGTFGVRGIIGVAWLPHSTPLDIFVELAPTLYLINSTGFGIDAGIGARYFF